MTKDIIRDGLMVLAMEASEERGRSRGRDSTLTAQALQSLCVHSSSYSSSGWAVSAGAIRTFRDFMPTGTSDVQQVVGHTDVVAEGGSEKQDIRRQTTAVLESLSELFK